MAKKTNKVGLVIRPEDSWIWLEISHCPVPDLMLQKYADGLIEWCQTEEAFAIIEFLGINKVSQKVFYDWANRYPPLKQAIDFARETIGARREKMGLMKKFDGSLVEKTMPLYNKEYKEWKMSQNKAMAEQMQSGPRIVVIEKFPATNEITESKNDK